MLSGMQKRPKRPRDTNQLGKLIVDLATGGAAEPEVVDKRDPAAVALGSKGGRARAAKLTKQQRQKIAREAAKKRWNPK